MNKRLISALVVCIMTAACGSNQTGSTAAFPIPQPTGTDIAPAISSASAAACQITFTDAKKNSVTIPVSATETEAPSAKAQTHGLIEVSPGGALLSEEHPTASVRVITNAPPIQISQVRSPSCNSRLWMGGGLDANSPKAATLIFGRADVAGDCGVYFAKGEAVAGGGDVSYDLSSHPTFLPIPVVTSRGISMTPERLELTRERLSGHATLRSTVLDAGRLPPAWSSGIGYYGGQCLGGRNAGVVGIPGLIDDHSAPLDASLFGVKL